MNVYKVSSIARRETSFDRRGTPSGLYHEEKEVDLVIAESVRAIEYPLPGWTNKIENEVTGIELICPIDDYWLNKC